eukprot:2806411-Amphidinium_carterae.2
MAKLHTYGVAHPLGMHARAGHFGPASVEVLHQLAKDSAPRLARETGQALGLVRAQHALRCAAHLTAQALTGTLGMMHSCVSTVTSALHDSLPLSASQPSGPERLRSSLPGPGIMQRF